MNSVPFLGISKRTNHGFCLEMGSDRFYLFKEMEPEWVLLLRLSDETGIRILQVLSENHKIRPSGQEMFIK